MAGERGMATEGSIRIPIRRPRRSAAKLSLTPLIDCVFILLIFFMLQSKLLRPHALTVEAPATDAQSAASATDEPPKVLYVELHTDGSAWFDGQKYDDAALLAALRVLDVDAVSAAAVAVDPGVTLQRAVDVVDALKRRGLGRVTLREAPRFKS